MPLSQTKPKVLPPQGHLLALDGIRGLAILMVVCSHVFESNYHSGGVLTRFVGTVFYYGYFGVDLFFVLSGFLITGILVDSLQDEGYFRKFYARRALRIFPLYYGVLLVCFLLTIPWHLHWDGMGWLLVLYLQNLRPQGIMEFSPGHGLVLFHFWSLAVEEQFYLIWPAVVFLVRGRRRLFWTTVAASAIALVARVAYLAAGGSPYVVHATTLFRADSLLLGGALALLYRSPAWPRVQRMAPWGFLTAAVLIVASILYLEPRIVGNSMAGSLWHEGVRYSILAPGFACLIAWSLQKGSRCGSLFQTGWLRFFGKYSYGLYVLHVFVMSAVNVRLRTLLEAHTTNKTLAVAAAACTVLLLSLLAAYLSYHLFERPFLRLKHHFDYRRPSLNQGSPEDASPEDTTKLAA
jgi:peptidoglycan/LPS O-acetylase OafA/YrhL